MDALLLSLNIPTDLTREESSPELLDVWKNTTARSTLSRLHQLLVHRPSDSSLSLVDRAAIVDAVTVYDGTERWTDSGLREMALATLAEISPHDELLIRAVLLHRIKPLFAPTPHPLLDDTTGRKRSRGPAGGSLAAQDHYEGQKWKSRVGVVNTLSWCVHVCKVEALEDLWHLIVPPIMTLLDDYETVYKLQGIRLASSLSNKAAPSLLKKTGLDTLIFSSYQTALTHLHDPLSAQLIHAAIRAALDLIIHATAPGSETRFERLCALLGDGIIGTVWTYGTREAMVVAASVDALPAVLQEMGIACTRYLKALVTQLIYPLATSPVSDNSIQIREYLNNQLSALRALVVVLDVCAVRMNHWKGTIIDGVGRCWVMMADAEACVDTVVDNRELREEVKIALRAVSTQLAKACPSVIENEYRRLSQVSPIFASFFDNVAASVEHSTSSPPNAQPTKLIY